MGIFELCLTPLWFFMGLELIGSLKDNFPFQQTVLPQITSSLHQTNLTSPSAYHFCDRDNTVCSSNPFIFFLDLDGYFYV